MTRKEIEEYYESNGFEYDEGEKRVYRTWIGVIKGFAPPYYSDEAKGHFIRGLVEGRIDELRRQKGSQLPEQDPEGMPTTAGGDGKGSTEDSGQTPPRTPDLFEDSF